RLDRFNHSLGGITISAVVDAHSIASSPSQHGRGSADPTTPTSDDHNLVHSGSILPFSCQNVYLSSTTRASGHTSALYRGAGPDKAGASALEVVDALLRALRATPDNSGASR